MIPEGVTARVWHPPQVEARVRKGQVHVLGENAWRLQLEAGEHEYRLAQLDDYWPLRRRDFLWRAPLRFALEARASAANLPGTWGFGFWNDPFAVPFGVRGTTRRWPALPNAAWFFYASPPNCLSLRDDLPAQGMLAATFSSPRIPALLLLPGMVCFPALFWPPLARMMRYLGRGLVRQATRRLSLDVSEWHAYGLEWLPHKVRFFVDEAEVFETRVAPRGPLGLVIWMDNQFAAFPPDGRLQFGVLGGGHAWLEVRNLSLTRL